MKTVAEAVEELKEKCKERDKLLDELTRSLAIKELWKNPKWPVRSGIRGSPTIGFHFYLKDSTDERREFELDEIPEALRSAPQIKKGLEYARRWGKK